MKCKNCGSEFEGKFCPECGTKSDAETTTISQSVQQQSDVSQQVPPVLNVKPAGSREKSQRNQSIKERGFFASLSFWHWG